MTETAERRPLKLYFHPFASFTLADCAAAPALFYSNWVMPFEAHKNVAAYFWRLMARPSFARVVEEAGPTPVSSPHEAWKWPPHRI